MEKKETYSKTDQFKNKIKIEDLWISCTKQNNWYDNSVNNIHDAKLGPPVVISIFEIMLLWDKLVYILQAINSKHCLIETATGLIQLLNNIN